MCAFSRFSAAICLLLLLLPRPLQAQPMSLSDTASAASVAPLVWQRPIAAAVTGGLLLAGTSTLWCDFSKRQNSFIREEFQLLRRNRFGFRPYRFDNVIQYLPLSATVALKLVGVPSAHNFWQLSIRSAGSFVTYSAIVQPTKRLVHELRPDRSSHTSFPSGHSAMAFAGAEALRLEYGELSPIIPAAGYLVATLTGLMRIYNDRHWAGDVLAGAAIGILSADITFWLFDRLDSRRRSCGLSCEEFRSRMSAVPSTPSL